MAGSIGLYATDLDTVDLEDIAQCDEYDDALIDSLVSAKIAADEQAAWDAWDINPVSWDWIDRDTHRD